MTIPSLPPEGDTSWYDWATGIDTEARKVTTLITAAAVAAGYQPLDSDLTAIAALTTTSYGRAFLALADAASGRTALGLGTAATAASGDFQPVDSDLTAIAALSTTAFGRSFLSLADAAAGRTLLGLGTAATVNTGTASGDVPLLSTGGVLPIGRLATGTPDGTKFVRDDGTLAVPAGSSGGAVALPMVATQYYGSPSAQTANLTTTNNVEYGEPVYYPAACTIDRLRVRVITAGAAASVVRLGVRSDDAGRPGSLIAEAGTVAADAVATVEVTCSIAIPSAGWYWHVGAVQGGTPVLVAEAGASPRSFSGLPAQPDPNNGSYTGYTMSGVSGSLPASHATRALSSSVVRILSRIA